MFLLSIVAISIDYEGCPPDKKFVRGWNWPCGMICCKIPGYVFDNIFDWYLEFDL